jgi:lipid-binding SYLF domain-containing protein
MKLFLILAFVLFCRPGPALWAQTSLVDDDSSRSTAENRLAKSAAALRTFQENAYEPMRTLLDNAHCIGVAPRRDRGQSGADAKGFVSCRQNRNAAWTNPAAIVISGGGTFWPVVGAEIDLIILAMNQSTVSHFGDREGMLGSPNLRTTPGPVRQDQVPRRNYPSILAYQQSTAGIGGIDIAGAAVSEDRATNTVLYGKELSNLAILSGNGRGPGPISVELFLAAFSSSISGQSGRAIEEPAVSPNPLVLKPE